MSRTFHQVALTLQADHWRRATLVLVSAGLLILAWITWAVSARIAQFEVSEAARLEVLSSPANVQAGFSGRVAEVRMTLGQTVSAGEVLIKADTQPEQLALAEEIEKESSLRPRIAAVQAQIHSEAAGVDDEKSFLGLSRTAAVAQVEQADAQWKLAQKDRDRTLQLRAEGIVSEAEAQRASSEAEAKRAALETWRQQLARLEPESNLRDRAREGRLGSLDGQLAALQGELATAEAERRRLEFEIERKTVRAPVSGRLAECLQLTPGAHVGESDRLGVILPSNDVHIVAEFDPASAFGKLRAGQSAVLRLKGYPWTQYGVVPARVSKVASEIRDGRVRVELSLVQRLHPRIELEHGLPGSVEVETERISPLALLLRTAGDLAGQH